MDGASSLSCRPLNLLDSTISAFVLGPGAKAAGRRGRALVAEADAAAKFTPFAGRERRDDDDGDGDGDDDSRARHRGRIERNTEGCGTVTSRGDETK